MSENTPPAPEEPTGENQSPPPPPPPPPPSAPIHGQGEFAAAPSAPSAPGVGQPAELVDRFVARIIDGVLLLIVLAPLAIGMIFVGSDYLGDVLQAIVTAVIFLGYYGYMESSRGQTVGKMVMKLRVLGPNGGNPTLEEAVKRNIWHGFAILGIVPIIGVFAGSAAQLVGAIMIAVGINNDTTNRQAWHDQFAGGTRVIKEG